MKVFKSAILLLTVLVMGACQSPKPQETVVADDTKNATMETILARRSVRKYLPQAVSRDTLQLILNAGINAPSAMNLQDWEVRVVDNQEFLKGMTATMLAKDPKLAERIGEGTAFYNAPAVVFVAAEKESKFSALDCGLLGENICLAAQSMGLGSVIMMGPLREIDKNAEAMEYVKKMNFGEKYELLYLIALGYPDEAPDAKPRKAEKVQFVD